MKGKVQILMLLCISVFILSCEKEVKLNRIEGTLSPGTEVTPASLTNIPMVLVKIFDTIDFASVKLEPRYYEQFYSVATIAGGNYSFDSLPDGNYLLACGYGFKFADVDYVPLTASKGSVNQVNKTVNRLPTPNSPETYTVEVQNRTKCVLTGLEFFVNNNSTIYRDIFVGQGYPGPQYQYCDFILDEQMNPLFRLSLIKHDTLVKTDLHPFFNGGWSHYTVYVGVDSILIGDQKYKKTVIMNKGWFFGNWIKVEYDGNGAFATN
jgi:hypothetical protein